MQQQINAGDSLSSIAQRQLGDWRKWRDLAGKNDLNPTVELSPGSNIEVPQLSEIASKAQPILGKVSAGLNSAGLGELASSVDKVSSQVLGYAKEAESVLGEVNGFLSGDTELSLETVLDKVGGLREYQGQGVQLVDWLLQ
jgi:hypothetical protein